MTQVTIVNGTYRNQPVRNVTFTLIKDLSTGSKGNFVTVKNEGQFPGFADEIRVRVDNMSDFQILGNSESRAEAIPAAVSAQVESDEEVMTRIRERFDILHEMTKACLAGNIRSVIVSGPPGVGKSFGVEQEIEKASLFDKISGKRIKSQIVKGTISAIGLFALLYKYSDPDCVLVFDDCDVWEDQDTINILKGALDSGKTRRISYNKDSRLLRDEGVPNTFNFHGAIIFITNQNFDAKRASKIQPHLDALQSRSHFLDLTLNTTRDKILRIQQIANDGALFANYDFSKELETEIIEFMKTNQTRVREMSLRMAIKIADLVKSFPHNWRRMAETTCMKSAN
jgi:hypothetical protein